MSKYQLPGAAQMRSLAKFVKRKIHRTCGFCILVFPTNRPGTANYISDCDPLDMVKALRETADRIEKNNTFPTIEEN